MSRTCFLRVRIAVPVSEKPSPQPINLAEPWWPGCEQDCPLRARNERLIGPGITAEMVAFFQEHPGNN